MKKNLPVLFAADVIQFVPSDDKSSIKDNIAYSGGIVNELDDMGEPIKIIVDLDSIELNEPTGERYPMVFSHGDEDWIGSFTLINDGQLKMNDIQMLDNPKANMVVDASKKNFPVKASIRVEPKLVEFVPPHETQSINGRDVSDVYVFKNSIIREVSATAFPKDRNTSLNLFSTNSQNQFTPFNVREIMTDTIEQPTQKEADLSALLAEAQKQLAQKDKLLGLASAKLSEAESANAALQSKNLQLAEEAATVKLELRNQEISSLEQCLGDFTEDERGKLQSMDDENFELISAILNRYCETKMNSEPIEEEPMEASESQADTQAVQMSERPVLHKGLFSDTVKGRPQKSVSIDSYDYIQKFTAENTRMYGTDKQGVI